VQAAVAILDRGWGRPLQMIAADPEKPLQIDFRWASSSENTPNAHTHAHALGTQIEAAIIDAVVAKDTNTENE